jgi:exodeoxyribonuclease VII small subunit
MAQVKFEEAIKRLEEIVAALEKGNLSLEDSLKIFEEGVKLSKSCLKILDDAEKKVEILLKEKDGKRRLKPFRMVESEPEGFEGSEDRDG